MALPIQKIDLQLLGGLDQKTQQELVDPGSALITLDNFVHDKGASYRKPPGNTIYASYPASGVYPYGPTAIDRLVAYKDEAVLCGTTGKSSVAGQLATVGWLCSAAPTSGTWQSRAALPPAAVTRRGIQSLVLAGAQNSTIGIISWDIAYLNGYFAVCYMVQQSGASYVVYGALIDAATGLTIPVPFSGAVNASATCRVVPVAGTSAFAFLWRANLSTEIIAAIAPISSPGTVSAGPSAILNSATTGGANLEDFDACGIGNTGFAVIYNKSGSPASVEVDTFDGTLTHLNSFTAYSGSTTTALGINFDGTNVWYAFATPSPAGLTLGGLSTALASAYTATQMLPGYAGNTIVKVSPGPGIQANGHGVVTWLENSIWGYGCMDFTASGSAITAGPMTTRTRILPSSKPFFVASNSGSDAFSACRYFDNISLAGQNLYFIAENQPQAQYGGVCNTLRTTGTIAPRLSIAPLVDSQNEGAPCNVAQVSATKYAMLNIAARAGLTTAGALATALELVTVDFAYTNQWQSAQHLDLLHLSAGCPCWYDGQAVGEEGFLPVPAITSASVGTSGAISTTCQYVAIYEYVDARGQIHRSAPSAPTALITASSQNINVVVQTLQIGNRPGNVRVVLYRTQASGSTYYRCTGEEAIQNATNDTLTITDNLANVTGNELLYTQPGTLGTAQPRVCPPSFTAMTGYNDRVWGVADDQNTLWYSGQAVPGEAPWWADLFQIPILGPPGPITAIQGFDGHMVVFKRNAIGYFDGFGPADNASGNDYPPSPSWLPTSHGCIEPRSLVVTPMGLMFQSLRGIELLSRSLEVQDFFGRPVESTLSQNPIITSAILNEPLGKVYFTCLPSRGSQTGVRLEYDLQFGTWNTRSLGDTTVPVTNAGAVTAAMIGQSVGVVPVYWWMTQAQQAYTENPRAWPSGGALSSYNARDNGQAIIGTLETGWIKLGGVQGYNRIRHVDVLVYAIEDSGIEISLAFDYNPTYVQNLIFNAAPMAAMAGYPVCQIGMHVGNQKCQAIRIKVQDLLGPVGSAPTGQSWILLGISLNLGVIGDLPRLPATQKG